jgi:lysophospholipid acyltransferase (LPLAT)-like uncharacterized protein
MSLTALQARAAYLVLHGGAITWRFHEEIPEDCAEYLLGQRPAVIAFWHSQMLPLWYRLRTLMPAAVVSQSRDGELLAGYLGTLRYAAVVRGSSTRGGSDALKEAVAQTRERSVLITPDGPRGPAREAKPGAILTALRGEVPLIVAGWTAEKVVRFRSWDRMEVPAPFSQITIRYARYDLDGLTAGSRLSKADLKRFSSAIDTVAGGMAADGADPAPRGADVRG